MKALTERLIDWLEKPLKMNTVLNNRYRLKSVLGMGSYGISYLAHDMVGGDEVVVKQLRKRKLKIRKGVESFNREIEILSRLDHPRIPKLIASFSEEGQLFFAMTHISGKTFEDLIFREGKKYGERESFLILAKILEIVADLHEKGIIHRDLRIPNIMSVHDQIYLIDFGLAGFLGQIQPDWDSYCEEKKLKREISPKSDFYSLAHFLLFLLYSSYTPQTRKERSWEEELSLSSEAKRVLRKMLQSDEPYQTYGEIMPDIKNVLNGGKTSVIV